MQIKKTGEIFDCDITKLGGVFPRKNTVENLG